MDVLCEDELGLILRFISNAHDRNSFSQVCKQWMRIEGMTRSSIRVLKPGLLPQLPKLLSRFSNIVTFKTTQHILKADMELIGQLCPNLETFDLGTTIGQVMEESVWNEGLCAVAKGRSKPSKIVLSNRHYIGYLGFASLITSSHNLTHLDLTSCEWVSDYSLRVIVESNCSKTLKILVLENCHNITDHRVVVLQKMCALEELNLGDPGSCSLTDEVGGAAISKIPTLKKLNLSDQIKITNRTIAAIANNCPKLETLDLSGLGNNVSESDLLVFSGHMCLSSLHVSYRPELLVYLRRLELE